MTFSRLTMVGAVLAMLCQLAVADPSAANRIANNKRLQPPSSAAFHQQYQQLAGQPADSKLYQRFVQRWQAAKADGWLLDVQTFINAPG